MASFYSSGSASTFQDLRNAIQTFVSANGFTNEAGPTADNRIIKKSPLFIKMKSNTKYLEITAGLSVVSSDITTPSESVRLGDPDLTPISFPINYELYLYQNPDEFYCVINYNGDKYQHFNFGVSNVPSIGGAGVWLTGMIPAAHNLTDTTYFKVFINTARSDYNRIIGTTAYGGYGLGYFFSDLGGAKGSTIHCGLEGSDAWRTFGASDGDLSYNKTKAQLADLPSLFNEADVLVPIQVVLNRVSGLDTIVADLVNVRYCRIDNRSPGDVVVFGSDSWKLYPMFSKNSAEKNGVPWATGAVHSGTFGIALKVPV